LFAINSSRPITFTSIPPSFPDVRPAQALSNGTPVMAVMTSMRIGATPKDRVVRNQIVDREL
jgi:hypothetical protein